MVRKRKLDDSAIRQIPPRSTTHPDQKLVEISRPRLLTAANC
jgi:hypothetical protein